MAMTSRKYNRSDCLSILFIALFSANVFIEQLDLNNYILGNEMLWRGENPYGRYEFFAPPWFAILFGWLNLLPINSAANIWLLINITAVTAIAILSIRWINITNPRQNALRIIGAVLSPAALFCYITGQISPLVTLSLLILLYLVILQKKFCWLLPIATLLVTLKPHIILLPFIIGVFSLIKLQNWKSVLVMFGSLFIAGLVSMLLVNNWLSTLINAWLEGDFRGGKPGLISPGYLGLSEFGIPISVFNLFGIYVFWLWWREGLSLKVTSLALAVNLLLVPYSRSYDYVVLILPILYLTGIRRQYDYWILGFALVGYFILPLTDLSVLTPVLITLALLIRIRFPPHDQKFSNAFHE